jgi:hypothetical protein
VNLTYGGIEEWNSFVSLFFPGLFWCQYFSWCQYRKIEWESWGLSVEKGELSHLLPREFGGSITRFFVRGMTSTVRPQNEILEKLFPDLDSSSHALGLVESPCAESVDDSQAAKSMLAVDDQSVAPNRF